MVSSPQNFYDTFFLFYKTNLNKRYQTLVSEVELPDYEYASNIYCLVYDRDEITKDDFLGMFSVPRNEVNENMATTPKWYSLYRTNPKFTEGEILASFQL